MIAPDRADPAEAIEHIESLARDATKVKGFTPAVLPRCITVFHDQLTSDALMAELVFEEDAVGVLREKYGAQFEEALASGMLHASKTSDRLPYSLLIMVEPEPRIQLVCHDSHGNVRGVVENDSPVAVDWAEDTFRRYREDAETIGMTRSAPR